MLVNNVTYEVLIEAAAEIKVAAAINTLNKKGTRHRVKLYPIVPDSAWQIDKSRKRICPKCKQKTKIVDISSEMAAFLFIPNEGQLIGECGCQAMPEVWTNYRRWKDERGDSLYQRISTSSFNIGRRVNAVCWHGFRDYFRAVFAKVPNAIFRTVLDTWRGSEDFEARYRDSGYHNIGSQMYPVYACEACRCEDSGIAE